MRASEAPKKLYVDTEDRLSDSILYGFTQKRKDDDIEYTRTDAFIEKAFEFFGERLWEYIDVKNANCDTFINIDGDKLKEDFKNYVRGEEYDKSVD